MTFQVLDEMLVRSKDGSRTCGELSTKMVMSSTFWSSRDEPLLLVLVHVVVGNLFRVGRQKVKAKTYRFLCARSFGVWRQVMCSH